MLGKSFTNLVTVTKKRGWGRGYGSAGDRSIEVIGFINDPAPGHLHLYDK